MFYRNKIHGHYKYQWINVIMIRGHLTYVKSGWNTSCINKRKANNYAIKKTWKSRLGLDTYGSNDLRNIFMDISVQIWTKHLILDEHEIKCFELKHS